MLLGFDVRSDYSLNPCIVAADLGYDDIRRNSGATCQSCVSDTANVAAIKNT